MKRLVIILWKHKYNSNDNNNNNNNNSNNSWKEDEHSWELVIQWHPAKKKSLKRHNAVISTQRNVRTLGDTKSVQQSLLGQFITAVSSMRKQELSVSRVLLSVLLVSVWESLRRATPTKLPAVWDNQPRGKLLTNSGHLNSTNTISSFNFQLCNNCKSATKIVTMSQIKFLFKIREYER
jgi:hypothetical protein